MICIFPPHLPPLEVVLIGHPESLSIILVQLTTIVHVSPADGIEGGNIAIEDVTVGGIAPLD